MDQKLSQSGKLDAKHFLSLQYVCTNDLTFKHYRKRVRFVLTESALCKGNHFEVVRQHKLLMQAVLEYQCVIQGVLYVKCLHVMAYKQ